MTTLTEQELALDPEVRRSLAARTALLERVREMLIGALHLELEPEEIDPDAPLFGAGLGLDSVDTVELVVALETTFGVRLEGGAVLVGALRTVNTVVDLILTEGARAGGAS
jgi:acyl carrier protein